MGNRYSAFIRIGGRLPRKEFMAFMEEVHLEGLGLDWATPFPTEMRDPARMAGLLDGGGHLRLVSESANYGAFPDLEEWLRSTGMAYDRHSDVDGGCDRVAVMWRPDMERPFESWASTDGDALVDAGLVIEAHKTLLTGDVPAALDLLHRSVGALERIGALPRFEITD
jgi:hypothetical protein